jgi:DNA polymerase (family 10)
MEKSPPTHSILPGLGVQAAERLKRQGYRTRAQLRRVASGLPREAQAHLRHRVDREIPLAKAARLARRLAASLQLPGGLRHSVVVVGSVRRKAPVSKDIDLLVVVPDKAPLKGVLAGARLGSADVDVYARGERRTSLLARPSGSKAYYAVDIFLATESEKPFALFHYTGGRTYNIRARAHAKRRGWLLNQYGLFTAGSDPRRRAPGSRSIGTEKELAEFLGMRHRPPADREK